MKQSATTIHAYTYFMGKNPNGLTVNKLKCMPSKPLTCNCPMSFSAKRNVGPKNNNAKIIL